MKRIEYFDALWNVFSEAFDDELRRTYEAQKELLDDPRYHFDCIESESGPAGFLAWWDFDDFIFIEHFAVDKKLRGKGVGRRALTDLLKSTARPVFLEVEPPDSEINKRRIAFYEKCGFFLLPFHYLQPPYIPTKQAVELLTMSTKQPNEQDFNCVRNTLYKCVYKLP